MFLQKQLSTDAPPFRRLRGYAFDPSLSTQLETAVMNKVVFPVRWEPLRPEQGDSEPQGRATEFVDSLLGNAQNAARLRQFLGMYDATAASADRDGLIKIAYDNGVGKGPKPLLPEQGDSAPQGKGPVGEYIEVVDIDPASGCVYAPVDLNDPHLLAQDGLAPSEGEPRFHQQMVYAVAMTTIEHFERALGRPVLWAEREKTRGDAGGEEQERFVQRLRIYPHALREANAYYSPQKVALLFGYFPAAANNKGRHFPGGMVFSCLSHDIIAHETTHALLDSMHRRYIEPNHPDVRAFHEAFADIVALFQHFSFPEVLRHQIARTRGDLRGPSLLGELAVQFGRATGGYSALRSAIGKIDPETDRWTPIKPDPQAYETQMKPHERGALLVAAVFDAFLAIYERRTADLLRIATGGSGVLPAGNLHPDVVHRLSAEAAKAAGHVLAMCIRALDYCPPIEITFGEYLRALITADADLVRNDDLGYRIAFIEAFRGRGLYPRNVRTVSEDSLHWPLATELPQDAQTAVNQLGDWLRGLMPEFRYCQSRRELFEMIREKRTKLHEMIRSNWEYVPGLESLTGLVFTPGTKLSGLRLDRDKVPRFQVSALAAIERVGPDGDVVNQVLLSLIQTRDLRTGDGLSMKFRGGCTLLIDLDTQRVRYAITKPIRGESAERRLERQREFLSGADDPSLAGAYFGADADAGEPFALLHRSHDD